MTEIKRCINCRHVGLPMHSEIECHHPAMVKADGTYPVTRLAREVGQKCGTSAAMFERKQQ